MLLGNLVKKWLDEDPEITKLYGEIPSASDSEHPAGNELTTDWLANSATVAPGHYVRYLVDKDGNAPSPNQLLQAIALMRQYASSDCDPKLASDIDTVNGLRVKKSSREDDDQASTFYFLCSDKNKRIRSASRVDGILKFCTCLERRLQAVPDELRDEPDVRPLSYTGYALMVMQRTKKHEGDGTSYLMAFVEHVLWYMDLCFYWESFVTSFSTSYDEARLGEIIINALSHSYHDTSYGVAVHPAGENCGSAQMRDKPHAEVEKCWADCKLFRFNKTPYEANMAQEVENIKRAAENRDATKRAQRATIEGLKHAVQAEAPSYTSMRELRAKTSLLERVELPDNVRASIEAVTAKFDRKIDEWEEEILD